MGRRRSSTRSGLAESDLMRAGRVTAAPTYVVTDDAELSVTATVAPEA